MPFWAAQFWLINHSLTQFRFTRGLRSCNTWFSKVFDVKLVLSPLSCVSNSKIKPLLMPFSIRVNLHVHVVLISCYAICLQKVARLNHAVEKKNIFSIPLINPFLRFLVLSKIFDKFFRKVSHFSGSKHVTGFSINIFVNIIGCCVVQRFTYDLLYGVCLCCILHIINCSCWLLGLANVVFSRFISKFICDL